MHLHNNFKVAGHKSLALKEMLWNAAKASHANSWKYWMNKLKEADPKAAEWLQDNPPKQWARSHFEIWPKCDILCNNYCQSFN